MSEDLLDVNSPPGTRRLPWDLTLVCDDRKFHVHQEVVCAQSKIISAEVSGPFVEGTTKIITIKEASPSSVAKMIEFLYRGDYCDIGESPNAEGIDGERILLDLPGCQPTNPVSRLEVNALVYFLADRYDILELRLIAAGKFRKVAHDSWPLPGFPSILAMILDNTPESDVCLRGTALKICADNIKDVFMNETWTEFLAMNGEVAVAIMTTLIKKHDKQKAVFEGKMRGVKQDLEKLLKKEEESTIVYDSRSWVFRTVLSRDLREFKEAVLKLEDDSRF